MLGDKYKIEVSFPGSGLSQTYPTNASFEWGWEKEDGQIYYRKKLNTNLFFRDNVDLQVELHGHDFGKLYAIERSRQSRCDKVDVIVYKRCNKTDAWVQHYNGYLSMIDGKWDVSHCVVEIPIRPQDQYTCLYENWEKDVSILSLAVERQTARSTVGVIEYKSCIREHSFTEPRCVSTEDQLTKGWTLVYWKVVPGGDDGDYEETQWAREVVHGSQPGPDFMNDGGVWVRGVEVVEADAKFNDGGPGVIIRQWAIVQYTLKNGMKLNDVLQAMVTQFGICGYKLSSIFFDINKNGDRPANRPYSKAFDHYRNLHIYEKSDVKRWNSDEGSSTDKLNISFKRMYENLKALFNLAFVIDEATKTIQIEHISYFKEKRMLDLTKERFLSDIKASWKYTYEKESIPLKEKFKFMESNLFDFDGLPIAYDPLCSNDNKDTNEKTITADYISTNVDSITFLSGQSADPDKPGIVTQPDIYSNEGMVLVEVSPTGYIVSGTNSLYNTAKRNNNLSWPNLQDFFYRHDRPQQYGIMNGQETKFDSFKRTRKQEPIQIQLCCSDFDQFDPLDLVKTQLGWGEIVSAKYAEPQEVMTLELIHD